MIFVRNPTGVSHSPAEFAERDDCLAGVEALTTVLCDLAGSGMTTFWAEHAWLPEGCVAGVRLEVVGDRFRFVTRGVPAGPGDEVLCGVVLPGLANGHSHAFHRALRGRTHDGGGTFWTWRRQMYAVAAQLDPDRYLTLARAVYAEMALAGYTVVGEFHYLHHDHRGRRYADPNAMGAALIEAAADAGIRLTLLDACYLAGGLNADGHLPLDAVQKRFSDGTVDRWQARVDELSGHRHGPGRRGRALGARGPGGGAAGDAGRRRNAPAACPPQ